MMQLTGIWRRLSTAAAAMTFLGFALGCRSGEQDEPEQQVPPPHSGVQVWKSAVPRDTAPVVPDSALAAVVEANNEFACRLYRELASSQSGNIFCSPWSVTVAMAMAWAGADGATER